MNEKFKPENIKPRPRDLGEEPIPINLMIYQHNGVYMPISKELVQQLGGEEIVTEIYKNIFGGHAPELEERNEEFYKIRINTPAATSISTPMNLLSDFKIAIMKAAQKDNEN